MATYQKIHYSNLILDDKNPRLPKSKHGQQEKVIIEYMLLEAATLELMQAIGENDFFEGEQLLVVSEEDDTYRVIEGNRRLVAVKLLNNPSLATTQKSKVQRVYDEADHRPDDIPCLIFEDESDILKYLGYRHITGIKSWKLLEKARYLYLLKANQFPNASFKEACRELAKMIGSRKEYVQRVIAGYDIFRYIEEEMGFYNIHNLDDTTFHFNYIAGSLNQSKIRNFLGIDFEKENPLQNLNRSNIKKWTHWLFEKNAQNKSRLIGDSKHLNMLNNVIGNPEALKAFEEDGISIHQAYELTDDIDNVFASAINKSLNYLEQANGINHKIREFNESSAKKLRSIKRLASNMILIKERMDDEL